MGSVALEGFGGGGASLNFKVVGCTTQPVSPTENTIWVNTSVAIPSWAFLATEPESPAAGMVWFPAGTSSQVAFNAIKKNQIQVYPESAKQYVDGAWVKKEASIYQAGQWVQFSTSEPNVVYLYNAGDTCADFSGGWATAAKAENSGGKYAGAPTIKLNETNMVMTSYSEKEYRTGIVVAINTIDLTDYKTLTFVGKSSHNTSNNTRLVIWSSLGNYVDDNVLAQTALPTSNGTKTIDVSSISGRRKIGFVLYNSSRTITMQQLYLQKA